MSYSADSQFLKGAEGYFSDLCRSIHIWCEFRKGFRKLRKVENCVTFFGSAQFDETNSNYKLAYETAYLFGKAGYTIMTGGGPGIMEAANKGAKEAGAVSIGYNIKLSHEQKLNKFTDININFNYFFIRKVMLIKYSQAFVLFPGGFGTMDEMFETANLIHTKKICNFPIVMMGTDYWQNLRSFIEKTMLEYKTIDEQEAHFAHITDNSDEALALINTQCNVEKL